MPSPWELHARRAILMAAATNGASIGSLQSKHDDHSKILSANTEFIRHRGMVVEQKMKNTLRDLGNVVVTWKQIQEGKKNDMICNMIFIWLFCVLSLIILSLYYIIKYIKL